MVAGCWQFQGVHAVAVDRDYPCLAGGVDGVAGRALELGASVDGDLGDEEDLAADWDGAEDLAVQHRRGECGSGQVGHAAGYGDVEVALDSFGEVAVEEAQDDAQVLAYGASV